MVIEVARALVRDVFRHGRARFPAAASGVLLGRPGEGGIALVVEAMRASAGGADLPAASDIEAAGREGAAKGRAVAGVWRTRSDGPAEAAPADLTAAGPGRICLVASVRGGEPAEWACWTPAADGRAPEPVTVRLSGE